MNARQKKFILEKLIPFIRREQGNGFAMSTWKSKVNKNVVNPEYDLPNYDDVARTKAPMCGTVACIGGSTALLINRPRVMSPRILGKALGLTTKEADGLFYRWEPDDHDMPYAWPAEFSADFYDAQTPMAKARVAIKLLKLVVKTNGQCLHTGARDNG